MANATTSYRGPDGRQWIDVTANKTFLVSEAGWVQNIIADGLTLTLPSTLASVCIIVRNGGLPYTSGPVGSGSNGTVGITLTPASGDGFTGNGFTAAGNKGPVNTKTTASIGDEIEFIGTGTNSAVAWNIARVKGTWARLA